MLPAPLLPQEGIAALGIDWVSLLVYAVNFALLVLILRVFVYKRVLGMLDSRSERIRESLDQADRVRKEAEDQQATLQRSLDEGRQEGQRLLAEARQAAERYREEQQVRARAEAGEMIERAREDIQRERDAAVEKVRAEFATLAVTAAERIIHKSLDAQTHKDLIDEVLASNGASQGRG
ncbi:MAG: F0F1 ATP synthase subunit B [Dehalococcoidia bacterium]